MNIKFQKLPEHKHVQWTQSWYEPALASLSGILEVRRENLRKRKHDENKAAVTRDEFIEILMFEHRMSPWNASEVISSLKRAGKIRCFGSFINLPEITEGES